MSSSFGNNKRKPGATAGAVTEAKRRATLAQNWDDYSKNRKVPGESIMPSIMGRNAGIQSMFYAQNNGANPYVVPPVVYYPGLTFAGFKWSYEGNGSTNVTLPTILDTQTWGQRSDSMLTTLVNTNYIQNGVFINISSDDVAIYVKGFYRAPATGSYTFTFQSDDGLQMRLNNQLIIDAVGLQNISVTSSAIQLVQGQYYPLEMLWSNHVGGAGFIITSITVNSTSIFTQGSGAGPNTAPSLATYPLSDCFFNSEPVISLPSPTITGALSFSNGYIQTPYPAAGLDLSGATTNFTIEWFQKMNGFNTSTRFFSIGPGAIPPINSTGTLSLSLENGTDIRLYINSGYVGSPPPTGLNLLNWNHFAVTRSGTSIFVYINGILFISTSGTLITNTSTKFVIGNWEGGNASAQFNGYITNFRVVVGTALYTGTSQFTPPSIPLRNITNTKLLLNAVSDTYKYYNTALTSTPLTSVGTTAPTFAALSDPLF